jgi:Domain of unknown function (DUF1931)
VHAFERLEEEIELRPILESLAARPPLGAALADDTRELTFELCRLLI